MVLFDYTLIIDNHTLSYKCTLSEFDMTNVTLKMHLFIKILDIFSL